MKNDDLTHTPVCIVHIPILVAVYWRQVLESNFHSVCNKQLLRKKVGKGELTNAFKGNVCYFGINESHMSEYETILILHNIGSWLN